MSATAASERPVHTVLSGPAGGVTSTVMIARRTGFKKLLAFDMGGTSTDVSVILDGEPTISRSTEVGYFPAKVPTLDVRSVGAGGGSIAEVSELTKSLRVGPRSAGAKPGPVAYGLGGVEPTVSDANVVLGYLPPVLLGRRHGARRRRRQGRDCQSRSSDGALGRRGGQGHHRYCQRSHARRAARHHRSARPRSARFRHRRLWRRGSAACQRAGRTARLLSGAGAAEPGCACRRSAFSRPSSRTSSCRPSSARRSASMQREVWSRFATLGEKAKAWLDEQEVAEGDRSIGYSLDLRYEQQGLRGDHRSAGGAGRQIRPARRNPRSFPRHPSAALRRPLPCSGRACGSARHRDRRHAQCRGSVAGAGAGPISPRR